MQPLLNALDHSTITQQQMYKLIFNKPNTFKTILKKTKIKKREVQKKVKKNLLENFFAIHLFNNQKTFDPPTYLFYH